MSGEREALTAWTATSDTLTTFCERQYAYRVATAARFEQNDYRDARSAYLRTSLVAKHKALTLILAETSRLAQDPDTLTREQVSTLQTASDLCGDPRFDLPRTLSTLTEKDLLWSKDLAGTIVSLTLKRLGSRARVDRQELTSPAYVGLAQAICKFDPAKNVRFDAYASRRIHGEITDYLRANDRIPRITRKKIKQGIDDADVRRISAVRQPGSLTSDVAYTPINTFEADEAFYRLIANFKPQHQQFMILRYVTELTYQEIGEHLGISEARACQLHNEIIRRLQIDHGTEPHKRVHRVHSACAAFKS